MTIIAKAFATYDPADTTVVQTVTLPDDADTEAWTLDHHETWWTYEHADCGCSQTWTDCCENIKRWDCETVRVLDSNGDPDVIVCMEGFGCDTDTALRNARRLSDTSAT